MNKFSVILLTAVLCLVPVSSNAAAGKTPASAKKLRVGLLVDKGSRGNGVFHLASLIAHSPQTELVTVMGQDIRDGKLSSLDVLVVSGGAAWRQFYAIGPAHISKLHDFLRKGGSYVGTCAGMTNVTFGKNRMNLLPFVPHRKATGSTGQVTVEISKEGAKLLGIKPGLRAVRYSGGPIVYKLPSAKVEGKGDPIAFFKTSVTRPGYDPTKFIGSPAILYGTFGKGKVIATSFHPEYQEENHDIMLGCFYAVTGVRMTPVYPKKNFRPVRVGIVTSALIGHGPVKTMLDLERHPDIDLHYIMLSEINKGWLRHLDFLVLPHADGALTKKYMNTPYSKKVLTEFLNNGGIILAGGNAADAVADHKNVKKLPAKVDFKKYILSK